LKKGTLYWYFYLRFSGSKVDQMGLSPVSDFPAKGLPNR
jgi:hypothetical protein